MKTTWPPDPNVVLCGIAPVPDLIRTALEEGGDYSVKQFEARKWSIDPWLHCHQVRHFAKKRLVADGILDMGYTMSDLPMSGILIANAECAIRVLRPDHRIDEDTGQIYRIVPNSNLSLARREYFYQPAFEWPSLSSSARLLKLVVLWGINSSYQLSTLDLVCTKEFDTTLNCVETYWLVPMQDTRAEGQGTEVAIGPSGPYEDLPFRPLGAGEIEVAGHGNIR